MGNLRNRLMTVLAACVIAVASSASVEAITLGTYVKTDSLQAISGGSAKTEILFWSTEEENFSVELRAASIPPGWLVWSAPPEFVLGDVSQYPRKQAIILPGRDEPAVARVVSVLIGVPEGEREGEYGVELEAIAGEGSGMLSVMQARKFHFSVFVKSSSGSEANNNDVSQGSAMERLEDEYIGLPGISSPEPAKKDSVTGQYFINGGAMRSALLLLAAALVIYVSWRIYRR